MLLVVGPKRSGKGPIIEVLTNLVGEINTVATSLDALSGQFSLDNWPGKTVAIIADARDPDAKLNNTEIVERLLTLSGGDTVRVNQKYMRAESMKLNVRIVIFTNEIPKFYDSSEAISSRFVILKMTNSFFGSEDTTLRDKLRGEMPAILHWAMEGWRRLQSQRDFTMPVSAREIVEEMQDLTSPVGSFVRQKCQVGADYTTLSSELYEAWVEFCKSTGQNHPGTLPMFAKKLRAAVPSILRERPRTDGGGDRPRSYRGIRLRPDSPFGIT
jgi:putative DNA primase/helicase